MAVHVVPLRDMMDRTRRNLEIIHELKGEDVLVWEVTQLVHSFAGLVLYPWEEWENEFRAIPLDSPEGSRWPHLEAMDAADDAVSTVGEQIRLVRNAFAHGNISFEADRDGEIESIVIWNSDNEGYRTWSARVHRDELKRFLDAMIDATSSFRSPRPKSLPLHKKHATKLKNPQCPTCGRTVKRGHPLYPTKVAAADSVSVNSQRGSTGS